VPPVRGRTRLRRWAGAGGSVPQDAPQPHRVEPSAGCVTTAVPQPTRPQPAMGVREGRDLFKEHLVLFREGFSSFFSSSELSATDVFSSSSFSSLFISLVPEETLLRPSPPDKPAEEAEPQTEAGGARPAQGAGGSPSPAPAGLHCRRTASRTHPTSSVGSTRSWRGALPCHRSPSFSPHLPGPPESEPTPPQHSRGPGAPRTHRQQQGQNTSLRPRGKAQGRNRPAEAARKHRPCKSTHLPPGCCCCTGLDLTGDPNGPRGTPASSARSCLTAVRVLLPAEVGERAGL